jgi:hypothetical protein
LETLCRLKPLPQPVRVRPAPVGRRGAGCRAITPHSLQKDTPQTTQAAAEADLERAQGSEPNPFAGHDFRGRHQQAKSRGGDLASMAWGVHGGIAANCSALPAQADPQPSVVRHDGPIRAPFRAEGRLRRVPVRKVSTISPAVGLCAGQPTEPVAKVLGLARVSGRVRAMVSVLSISFGVATRHRSGGPVPSSTGVLGQVLAEVLGGSTRADRLVLPSAPNALSPMIVARRLL